MQIGGSLGQGLLCSLQTIETRRAHPPGPRTKCRAPRGLPSPIQTDETRKAHPRDPGSSATRLGPWALSVRVVDSLGSKKNGIIVLFIEKGNLITLS